MKGKTLKAKVKPKIQTIKCPVYKCFKELENDEALFRHYESAHKDLKEMGLDL